MMELEEFGGVSRSPALDKGKRSGVLVEIENTLASSPPPIPPRSPQRKRARRGPQTTYTAPPSALWTRYEARLLQTHSLPQPPPLQRSITAPLDNTLPPLASSIAGPSTPSPRQLQAPVVRRSKSCQGSIRRPGTPPPVSVQIPIPSAPPSSSRPRVEPCSCSSPKSPKSPRSPREDLWPGVSPPIPPRKTDLGGSLPLGLETGAWWNVSQAEPQTGAVQKDVSGRSPAAQRSSPSPPAVEEDLMPASRTSYFSVAAGRLDRTRSALKGSLGRSDRKAGLQYDVKRVPLARSATTILKIGEPAPARVPRSTTGTLADDREREGPGRRLSFDEAAQMLLLESAPPFTVLGEYARVTEHDGEAEYLSSRPPPKYESWSPNIIRRRLERRRSTVAGDASEAAPVTGLGLHGLRRPSLQLDIPATTSAAGQRLSRMFLSRSQPASPTTTDALGYFSMTSPSQNSFSSLPDHIDLSIYSRPSDDLLEEPVRRRRMLGRLIAIESDSVFAATVEAFRAQHGVGPVAVDSSSTLSSAASSESTLCEDKDDLLRQLFIIREMRNTERNYSAHLRRLLDSTLKATSGTVEYSPTTRPPMRKTGASLTMSPVHSGRAQFSMKRAKSVPEPRPRGVSFEDKHLSILQSQLPALIAISSDIARLLEDDPTPWGSGTCFLSLLADLTSLYSRWSEVVGDLLEDFRGHPERWEMLRDSFPLPQGRKDRFALDRLFSKREERIFKLNSRESKPLGVDDILIAPIQRVTRYVLFFQALAKVVPPTTSTHGMLEECVAGAQALATACHNQSAPSA